MDSEGEEATCSECVGAAVRQGVLSDDTSSCGRLTAAEELRGHLLDCISLYASRFEHTAVTLACIETLPRSSPSSLQSGALRESPKASETDNNNDDDDDDQPCWEGHICDTSTALAVLFIHAGEGSVSCTGTADCPDGKATATLVGVVVAFDYWGGFTCIAERRYASSAEAQDEAAALESRSLTVSEVLKMQQWKRIREQVTEGRLPTTLGNTHANGSTSPWTTDMTLCSVAVEEGTVPRPGIAYECLMALLVSTYL
ncbi:hypothetical protein JKF63_06385 [Porcisia hertigi]|uniref:Uncharacterized protein n=1 Tax=Porcisia hertigi TaxID=2761500 RepID=A0A836YH98_9TRYP|nr:hypothetical protein JKF63_06385 [Porcisia hertigi]